jgi:hypothetical protein
MAVPTSSAGREWWNKIFRWFALHPYWTLTLAVCAVLAPFLTKPFNLDDPLFIWVAQQIYLHPADPYGFDVNWAQTVFPLWNVTDNPPLACYYLALGAGFFGWSEIGLHLAFLLPALAVTWGTYRLARHFCDRPMLAALAALFTPVFLVSSLTVMCDMLMLAFWVWAVVWWVEGLEGDDFGRLAGSGLFMALASLTKYYGMCLIPLLGAYGLLSKGRPGRWMIYLLVPVATLWVYQAATRLLYDHNLLFRAAEFTSFVKGFYGYSPVAAVLVALAFTGGCAAVAVVFTPLLWRTPALVLLGALTALVASICLATGAMSHLAGAARWTSPVSVKLQIILWAAGGICVLALAITDVFYRRDARSCLLALWVVGTFSFAAFFNWTINGRTILPVVPAMGILLVRRLGRNFPAGHRAWSWGVLPCLIASAVLALLVARADFLQAEAVRQNAREICAQYRSGRSTVWFQGHWGFQYYMEKLGASALDLANPALKAGDTLAVPLNNTTLRSPKIKLGNLTPAGVITAPKSRFLATMDQTAGAGFYAANLGPLPFAFGHVPPESVVVYAPWPASSPNK